MIPISSGKVETAKKIVIYGPEGIGKSTLASKFPDPVFIDTEGSTKQLDVRRYPAPESWENIITFIDDAISGHTCKTLVIDTADWAEQLCAKTVIYKLGIKGIEDVGYGKGYTYLAEEFSKLLDKCSGAIKAGINIVFTAHAQMRKFEQPDELGAYDRWEMKLNKKTAALLKEWADMILFCNYKTMVVTDSKTKSKKATGGQRVMYSTHHPCWDAKNRFDLPDSMEMDFDCIAHIFNDNPEQINYKDVFQVCIEGNGLTMEDIKTFSEAKGNYPGTDPQNYPIQYKEALMRPESIKKIKDFIKEDKHNV